MRRTDPASPAAPSESGSPTRPVRPSGLTRLTRLERRVVLVLAVAAAVFVAVRLGPSLLGLRVFLGTQLLDRYPPWSGGDRSTSVVSKYVADQIDFFTPGLAEIRERLFTGDVAAWSTYASGGSSLLGTPVFGVLSPGRWLYLLLPTALAPGWSKLLELAFAATFTVLLVRRLGGSRAAAGLAALVYPTTGFMIAWTNWPQTAVGAEIPFLFWAVERFVQLRRATAAVPVALGVALLLFGGFPAVTGQTLYVVAGYAVVRLLAAHGRAWWLLARRVLLLGGAVVLGAGLTAVQLVPFVYQFLETVDLSYREAGFFREEPLTYLLTSVFPGSFAGNNLTVYTGPFNPVETATYVGSAVLLLVAVGLVTVLRRRRGRSAELYLAAVAVFVLVVVWFQGPWTSWLNALPIFADNPVGRWRSQLGVPVAVLAGVGLDRLLRAAAVRRDRLRDGTTLGAAAGVTAVVAVGGLLVAVVVKGLSPTRVVDVAVTVLPLLVVGGLLVLGARSARVRRAVPTVLVLAVLGQAVAATHFFWPTSDRADFYPRTSTTDFLTANLAGQRIATTSAAPLLPNATSMYGIRTLNAHAFTPRTMRDLMTAIDPTSFRIPTYSVFSLDLSTTVDSPGLDRMAVRYLVATPTSPIPGDLEMPGTTGEARPLAQGAVVTLSTPRPGLRGIVVPLDKDDQGPARVTVVVRRADGTVETQETTVVRRGTEQLRLPLVLDAAPGAGNASVTLEVDNGTLAASTAVGGGLQYGVVRAPATSDGLTVAFVGEGVVVYERTGALPRIRWAGEATVVADAQERRTAVADDPVEPGQVILSAEPDPVPAGSSAALQVQEDGGDTVAVRVEATGAGMLVVADNLQEDFAATVDGTPVPIVDADYAGAAVAVPAGTHEVRFVYAPRGRALGVAVSAVSAAGIAALALVPPLWTRLRHRPTTAPEPADH